MAAYLTDHKLNDLIGLIRQRYPAWDGFSYPAFVADEITPKQKTIAKAVTQFDQKTIERLISQGEFPTIIESLNKLANDNNLLWRRAPSQGDTAVLLHPNLDPPVFCTQIRNLLFGDQLSPERLAAFSTYLTANGLPNKWPFPTYFLFIYHPESEMFVKPRTVNWFLQFMGAAKTAVSNPPSASAYTAILENANALKNQLLPYGVGNMVDVQSFIWVASQESKARTGGLDNKGQIALDVPPTEPITAQPAFNIAETAVTLKEPDNQADWATNPPTPAYSLSQFSTESGYPLKTLQKWAKALDRKKQVIFYGPPGTGKTYAAQKLAQRFSGGSDGFWELVQFHPAYAYEDFMQGIRPLTQPDGVLHYQLAPGRFKQFCERASRHEGICVFVIDEINRANIASVFGELMYLLEYRDERIKLAGGGSFHIPHNVRLIGAMNTADRSIALVDHALRRRFAFIHLEPDMAILRRFHQKAGYDVKPLIALIERLNNQINDPHYAVGHSFFLQTNLPDHLEAIWQMEIEPYLEEYFFDQPDRVTEWRWTAVQELLA